MGLPDLLEMQKNSFKSFLQLDAAPEKRKLMGLQAAFLDVFPIESADGSLVLDFVRYSLGPSRYTTGDEAQSHDATWSRPLSAVLRLSSRQPSGKLKQVIEQDVILCEIPTMTDTASFVINGAERVVVSQLHRSPGIIFEEDEEKKISSLGKKLFFARVIPYRGAWVEFEFDINNILFVRIDRKKKFEATTFLRACGVESDSDILKIFYRYEEIPLAGTDPETLVHRVAVEDAVDRETGEVLIEAGKKITHEALKRLADKKITSVKIISGDPEKDDSAILETLRKDKIKSVREAQQEIYKKLRGQEFIVPGQAESYVDNLFFKSLRKYDLSKVGRHKINSKLHRYLWTLAGRRDVVARPDNRRHKHFALPSYDRRTLCLEDVIATIQYLVALNCGVTHLSLDEARATPIPAKSGSFETPAEYKSWLSERLKKIQGSGLEGKLAVVDIHDKDSDEDNDPVRQGLKKDRFSFVDYGDAVAEWRKAAPSLFDKNFLVTLDDIDHLGNRRVRSVGELLENQIRMGLAQMSRVIRDRMSVQDKRQITPRSLINTAPLVGILRKFFGTSQLSQFMDQINPLAEITHKRRLSALGPGGLHRKRAGFEVRDVHYTHYGRVCPIETPEGPNIGLITSLAAYARINEFGLIESPYRRVKNGKLTGEVNYLGADQEGGSIVAQANTPLDKEKIAAEQVSCRSHGDFPVVDPSKVDYMDISPIQVVSVSAALVPFLEHDDANRALMGANMQRQAVPLLKPEAPVVATGIEDVVARDSGACIVSRRAGKVLYATGDLVAVHADGEGGEDSIDLYSLKKYRRSNQDTCVNQKPIVSSGERVKAGQVLADGPATDGGQLALGRNLLVGFLPWEGYNFEDAILISERLVREDIFTSIHVSEFEVEARDTKLGPEEITRDIPNVSTETLESLDESGIVIPSTYVRQGDVLVGKVTPKGEQQLTPEERLLKVIFGKKAEDVQDASMRVPPGVSGKVIGVKVFVRREKMSKADEKKGLDAATDKLERDLAALREYRKQTAARFESLGAAKRKEEEERLKSFCSLMEKRVREEAARVKENIKEGDDLAVTVNRVVKVYIASRRKIQVGDKCAGRHGNKGVISKILPEEDMPFLPDGTPLDVVLSPLGVPSRMNVGQLLETMLGWAAHTLDTQMVNPVFDSASEKDIHEKVAEAKKKLKEQGMPEKYLPTDDCRITLYDGRTGEPFQEKVSIGYMYVLKLIHLVEDKIHARSTGPYSLITRQPLGGKAQFGGQRFGEMEVWAIEGYGAAYALQEFLTVKSDDVIGRTKMYESIIKGEPPAQPGVPESFKVLVRELQALGLNVELLKLGKDGHEKASGKKDAKEIARKS